jgi:hypothetical protein
MDLYYGHGVLTHRSKCTYYEKYIFKMYFKISKKIGQKIMGVNLNIYVHPPKFCGEKIFLVAYGKKTKKKGHINSNFVAPKIVFFTHAAKKILFSQTW